MPYSQQISERALETLALRRLRSAELADRRREELFSCVPGLRELENEMVSLGAEAAKLSLAGGEEEQLKAVKTKLGETRSKQRALLKNCGLEEDALESEPFCPLCRDTGYLEGGAVCSCLKKLMSSLALAELNRLSPLELSSFERFSLDYYSDAARPPRSISARENAARVLAACKRFAASFPEVSRDLLLMGDAGLGKTHLALSIARETLGRGCDVLYCSAAGVFKKIEAEHFELPRSAETLERLKTCELLVLDDLGAEFNGPFVSSALYDLINTRLNARRHTVYTSNLTEEREITRRYGEKISSRLVGCCTVLPLFGEDIRKQQNRAQDR